MFHVEHLSNRDFGLFHVEHSSAINGARPSRTDFASVLSRPHSQATALQANSAPAAVWTPKVSRPVIISTSQSSRGQPAAPPPDRASPCDPRRAWSHIKSLPDHLGSPPHNTRPSIPRDRKASRRNADFFVCDSARVTAISGRHIAMGIPGNPRPIRNPATS